MANQKEPNKEHKKIVKFDIPIPKFSQLQMRAMERKRTPRPITPLLARVKRKEAMWEFKKKKLAEIRRRKLAIEKKIKELKKIESEVI